MISSARLLRSLLPALLGAAATLSVARPAAAVLCSSLPMPVYVAGSGDVAILDVSKALAPAGISVIYKQIGSCLAVDAILNGTKIGSMTDPLAAYYDATGLQQSCTLDPAGQAVDVGVSDVFASTCTSLPNGLPNGLRDFFGPVEAHTFAVPKKSTQKAISKTAGYFVFGFGKSSGVAPWTDPAFLFHRAATSGTQQMISVGIGVPAAKWQGQTTASSGELVNKLATSTNPEASLGILTAEVAQANPSQVSILAYKDTDQSCAYYPDSTQSARDKLNVRDGHYALWGPLHMHTQVDAQNQPLNMVARKVLAYIVGTLPPPAGVDLIALFAQANLVPQCAMRVSRTSELGALMSVAPMHACGCYFEQTAAGSTMCKPCMMDTDCGTTAPRCNYGFCEAQ